jgi:hypothetical protein
MPFVSVSSSISLRGGEATGDIDAVVVAAEPEFLVKEEFLNLAMP